MISSQNNVQKYSTKGHEQVSLLKKWGHATALTAAAVQVFKNAFFFLKCFQAVKRGLAGVI